MLLRSTFAAVLLICLPLGVMPSTLAAQDKQQPERRALDLNRTYYYLVPGQAGDLTLGPNRDTIGIDLALLRMLRHESIRNEIELKDVGSLTPLFEDLRAYESEWMIDFNSASDEVRRTARKRVDEFRTQLKRLNEGDLLTDQQRRRLDQLRWRFVCLGSTGQHSPANQASRQLNLTDQQGDQIRAFVQRDILSLLQVQSQFDELKPVLKDDQRSKLEQVVRPFMDDSIPVAASIAQLNDLFQFQNPDSTPNAHHLTGPIGLIHSGQLTPLKNYLEPYDAGVDQVWKQTLNLVLSGKLDWLELTRNQQDQLAELRTHRTNESGTIYTYYYGRDEFESALEDFNIDLQQEWTIPWHRKYHHQRREGMARADEKLGRRIQSILIEDQIQAIQVAQSCPKVIDLGLFHVVENLLADYLELDAEQIKQIRKLRQRRREKLEHINRKLESFAREQLDAEQRKIVDEFFGDYFEGYPSVYLALMTE